MAAACGRMVSCLKRLQVFDDRPAFVVRELGAVFMAAIAVAIRVGGVGDEIAVLERRLLGVVADILRVENAAPDHEARPAVLGGLQQLPQVGHRAVVETGRRRPDAI
jgi:hypothetical protein